MGLYKLIEKKKKEQKRKENIKVLKVATATTLLGTAAGVLSGVLFAPKSGEETREEIKVKATELADNAKIKVKSAKINLNEKISESKDDLKEARAKISEYLASKKDTNLTQSEEVSNLELSSSEEDKEEKSESKETITMEA